MAGTTLRIRDAIFTKVSFNLRLPFTDGLIGEYVFGNNNTQSIKNLANPALSATVVGVPTYGPYHARIQSITASHGFNLGYSYTTPEVTIIHVAQVVTNNANWSMSITPPITGFFNLPASVMLSNANTGSVNQASFLNPTHGNYSVVIGTCPLSAKHRAYTWTDGVRSMNEAAANGGASRGGGNIVIGTTTSGAGSGITNMAYTAIFNRTLTDSEIDQVYLSLKNFYNGKLVVS